MLIADETAAEAADPVSTVPVSPKENTPVPTPREEETSEVAVDGEAEATPGARPQTR